MKKALVLMASAAMLLATVSCTKEGEFNPKEKIATVYQSYMSSMTSSYGGTSFTENDTTPKHMTEKWEWDGKLLSSISHYYYNSSTKESEFSYKLNMTYDGKQLTKVAESNEDYTTYTYDGSKITKVEEYSEGKLVRSYDITHDGKKIVKIVMTDYEEGEISKSAEYTLGMLLPTRSAVDAIIQRKATKGGNTEVTTIDLTYDGSNVSKMVMAYGTSYTYTAEYTFDKKKNPFYGCYATVGGGETSFLNENNVLTEKYTMLENGRSEEPQTTTYVYEYDGKYPVSVSYTNTYSGEYSSQSSTHTTYYEYAE